jgi:tRNA A37 threonylcarbamoyladenosine modification protein TsaB
MAVAKGIALASGGKIALIGVPTLDIVAAGQPHIDGIDTLCAIVQAGRGRVSAGMYAWAGQGWEPSGAPFLATWGDLINRLDGLTLVAGEIDPAGRDTLLAAPERAQVGGASSNLRRAGTLAGIAAKRLASGQVDHPAALAPMYLNQA